MARKEFTFRGRTEEELKAMSVEEFTSLLPSAERRKLRRGLTAPEKSLLAKLAKRDRVKTRSRAMIIFPSMFGKTILVHNGKEGVPVLIQPEMVGKRLGTYALTRKMVRHSAGGVSQTKDSGAEKKDEKKAGDKK